MMELAIALYILGMVPTMVGSQKMKETTCGPCLMIWLLVWPLVAAMALICLLWAWPKNRRQP